VKLYNVVFTPEAQDQLTAIYRYIAVAASPSIALRYTNNIVAHCEGLANFPNRGAPRSDLREGLRTTNYKGRTVIAYAVDDVARQITIIGVFYGGQDFEATLHEVIDE
jgi:plasmid stabilization system protein ParE